ncbi:MAG: ABC transporter substrate-binding protein [Candidatus Bipolaricaulota bacterium]
MTDNKLISLTFLTLVLSIGLVFSGTFAVFGQEQVTFVTSFGGEELEVFKSLMDQFTEDTGIEVQIQAVGRDLQTALGSRVEAGNPPDMANLPNPGLMNNFARKDQIVSLDWFKDTDLADKQAGGFIGSGSYDGTLYGVVPAASVKSLVWYNKKVFEEKGYEVPETIGELLQLQNRMIADGYAPWAFGLESGQATGWPGTDWLEDIMLRSAGPEVYDQWVNHDIPWTDPRVAEAFRIFDLFINDDMVMGGRKAASTINFGDAAQYILPTEGREEPRALMHRQATFIQDFIEDAHPDAELGEEYDTFIFPSFGKESPPILFAGDLFIAFKDKPEVRELIRYFASADIQQTWVEENPGRLAVNVDVPLSAYPNETLRNAAQALKKAETARFDGSDSMPAAVGSGSFWTGVVNYVQGEQQLSDILESIENDADNAYEAGDATN